MTIDKTVLSALTNVVGSEARAIEIISSRVKNLMAQGAASLILATECERMSIEQKGDRTERLNRWAEHYDAYCKSIMMLAELVGNKSAAKLLINGQMN